ncbi:MAG: restriction endonuclease, partial [Gammaproteobacteria bacterium]|nr:restriction endonuclease [Gammaproteobacteria bacterium]
MTANPIEAFLPEDIRTLYEVHNYRSAAQVLATGCPEEFEEILEGLRAFRLTLADIRKPGGNESDIPKRISGLLRAKGWMETKIQGDLLITKIAKSDGKKSESIGDEEENEDESDTLENFEELKQKGYNIEHITRENFLDGHK